jgi:hypothetical protein
MATKPTAPKSARKAGTRPAGGRAAKPKLVQGTPEGEGTASAVEGTVAKSGGGVRMKDLIDRVVTATGGKKADVKGIVEATLAQMGEVLKKGEALNLPALGKMRVARQGAEGSGAMTLKLRQGGGKGKGKGKGKPAGEKEALAEAEDQE